MIFQRTASVFFLCSLVSILRSPGLGLELGLEIPQSSHRPTLSSIQADCAIPIGRSRMPDPAPKLFLALSVLRNPVGRLRLRRRPTVDNCAAVCCAVQIAYKRVNVFGFTRNKRPKSKSIERWPRGGVSKETVCHSPTTGNSFRQTHQPK